MRKKIWTKIISEGGEGVISGQHKDFGKKKIGWTKFCPTFLRMSWSPRVWWLPDNHSSSASLTTPPWLSHSSPRELLRTLRSPSSTKTNIFISLLRNGVLGITSIDAHGFSKNSWITCSFSTNTFKSRTGTTSINSWSSRPLSHSNLQVPFAMAFHKNLAQPLSKFVAYCPSSALLPDFVVNGIEMVSHNLDGRSGHATNHCHLFSPLVPVSSILHFLFWNSFWCLRMSLAPVYSFKLFWNPNVDQMIVSVAIPSWRLRLH